MISEIAEPVLPVWEATKFVEGWDPHSIYGKNKPVGPPPSAEDIVENRNHEILTTSSPNLPTVEYDGPAIGVVEGEVEKSEVVPDMAEQTTQEIKPMTDEELEQTVRDAMVSQAFKTPNALANNLRKSQQVSKARVSAMWKKVKDEGSA